MTSPTKKECCEKPTSYLECNGPDCLFTANDCHNCGNPYPASPTKSGWEERRAVLNATNEILALIPHIDGFRHDSINDKVDSIIHQTLKEHREKLLSELEGEVEGMRYEGPSLFDIGSEFATPRDYRRASHNAALDAILSLIHSKDQGDNR